MAISDGEVDFLDTQSTNDDIATLLRENKAATQPAIYTPNFFLYSEAESRTLDLPISVEKDDSNDDIDEEERKPSLLKKRKRKDSAVYDSSDGEDESSDDPKPPRKRQKATTTKASKNKEKATPTKRTNFVKTNLNGGWKGKSAYRVGGKWTKPPR